MKRIAKFEKVSFEQFKKDMDNLYPEMYTEGIIKEIYDDIKIPCRATSGSAGYDFFCPINFKISEAQSVVIPTGIRAKMEDGWVLKIYPRSGYGFKYGMHLLNTTGIIDSDYYSGDNEGHIMIKLSHTTPEYIVCLNKGNAFAQGIFVEYGITEDDECDGVRNGGFGSTGK